MSHLLPLNIEPDFSLFEKQNLTQLALFFLYVECYYQKKFQQILNFKKDVFHTISKRLEKLRDRV